MAISVTSLTVLGTACPWKLGSSANNAASANILLPYGGGYSDGTPAAGGATGQNASYKYGKSHTDVAETGPTLLAVTPGQIVFLEYVSGTVATQASGAGSSPPTGSPTTTLTPLPASESTANGYSLPTNVIKGRNGGNFNGVVSTSGTAVTWVSGSQFTNAMLSGEDFNNTANGTIWINNVAYTISKINSATTLTLTTSAGTQTSVNYFTWGANTSIGGLVGAFTDALGNVLSTFDWVSWGGINPASFVLTFVSSGSYTGTITGGASNAFAGYLFTITGFTNAANNGTFLCTASSTSSLTLQNINSVSETHAGTAQQLSIIALNVPVGAAFLSLGINDDRLSDNTGSFLLSAIVLESDYSWAGDRGWFPHLPASQWCSGFTPDHSAQLKATAFLTGYFWPQTLQALKLVAGYTGQLFPRGGVAVPIGSGQVFPS